MDIGDIEKITIVSWSWIKTFKVWEDDIVEINNKKTEEHTTWFIYHIYEVIDSWENIIARIENCPVVIEYKNK